MHPSSLAARLQADVAKDDAALSTAVAAYIDELDAIDAALLAHGANPFQSQPKLAMVDREVPVLSGNDGRCSVRLHWHSSEKNFPMNELDRRICCAPMVDLERLN